MSDLSILGVFAHPDDEQLMSGVFARAAAEGIRTGLICATRGEVGEIADPSLATAETLGQVREAELRAAATVLGIKYLWFLDYRDSGMKGTPENDYPGCFLQCDADEALEKIVRIVRDFKPTVMVTFDRTGGYGHPDHLTVHRLATDAFSAAADPGRFPDAGEPWQTARLYYSAFPRSLTRRIGEFMEASDVESAFRGLDLEEFGMPDEEITHYANVRDWIDIKERSLGHHRTQMNPNSPWSKMPEQMREFRSTEYFSLAAGVPLPDDPSSKDDLFAGLWNRTPDHGR
jgi:LmbE family N-acetylglucosaminyl deacetylase